MVDLAWKMLLHDRLRFFITVSGVAFAVTLVFVQVGLFRGLLNNASVTIEHIDAELWVTSKNTPNIDFAQVFPETQVARARSTPGVARADNLLVAFMPMALPNGAHETTLIYALEDFSRWNIPWNASAEELANLRRGRYFLLDESATRRFGPFRVGDYREVLDTRLRIIGTTSGALSFTTTPLAFMDYRIAQALLGKPWFGKTNYILVKLATAADIRAVQAELRLRFPHNDVHTREEWAERSRTYWVDNTGIGLNMYVTVFLGCLVGVVVVAQTLYTATMDHLKEFGTLKAIGGENRDIYRILGKQAIIAAVVGFSIGGAISYITSLVIPASGLRMDVSFTMSAIIFAGTLLFCLLAALFSFKKVAGIDPALVFRT